MSGTFVGCSRPRPCSGRKQLRRCGSSRGKENVVLIDVDGDNFDNVIVIDVPESLPTKLRASSVLRKGRKSPCPRESAICLDDEENGDSNYARNGVKVDSVFNNGASSSTQPYSTSGKFGMPSDAVGDECQFVQENVSPVKLSKCKRTYSGKASGRNRYGLSTESASSSDSDYPDCELMEDSFGTLRKQWEKAFSKRKCDVRKARSSVRDPDLESSATRSNGHVTTKCSQPKETTFEGEDDEDKQSPASFNPKEKGNLGYACDSVNGSLNEGDDYLLESILKAPFCSDKEKHFDFRSSLFDEPPFEHAEFHSGQNLKQGGSSFCDEEKQGPEGPSSFPFDEPGTSQVDNVGNDFEKSQGPGEPCQSKPQSCSQQHCDGEANLPEKDPSLSKVGSSRNRRFDHGKSNSGDRGKIFSEKTSSFDIRVPWTLRDIITGHGVKLAPQQASYLKHRLSDKHVVGNGFTACTEEDGHPLKEALFEKLSTSGVKKHDPKRSNPLNGDHVRENTSVSSSYINEMQPGLARSCSVNKEEGSVYPMRKCQQEDIRDDPVSGQDGETTINNDGCIISEREKLKETDEYKKAIEEEWASRQRVLQVQSEEAKLLRRLRKKREAESLRLLDMERRQKLRLEEIRETQKKDEENMNMKDAIRAEVRKELSKLELGCHDMASVLRGLGILVGGGLHPLLIEVCSAYKRALLTFHPDRASRSDIRQQVEAEEKFKLISRMKDKFTILNDS